MPLNAVCSSSLKISQNAKTRSSAGNLCIIWRQRRYHVYADTNMLRMRWIFKRLVDPCSDVIMRLRLLRGRICDTVGKMHFDVARQRCWVD